MIEIGLHHYNEMLRYEPAMDRLRALALYITRNGQEIPRTISSQDSWQEDLFMLIKHFSRVFAEDIEENGMVTDGTVGRFTSAIVTVERNLGIKSGDVEEARQRQLYMGSGFWEMRRFLGQFTDIAEELAQTPPNHIISAGISGCVVAEYLGLKMEKKFRIAPTIDHMIFSRDGAAPIAGVLSKDFTLSGKNVLLVEDAVEESRTLGVMVETLLKFDDSLRFDLFSLAIDNNQKTRQALGKMTKVYSFEE